jgi:hypothetical protein
VQFVTRCIDTVKYREAGNGTKKGDTNLKQKDEKETNNRKNCTSDWTEGI